MGEGVKTAEYLLELLRCGLNGQVPEEKPAEVTWRAVFALAKRHSVSAMAYSALPAEVKTADPDLVKAWAASQSMILAKHVVQEHEYERICALFSENGVAHLPLKGLRIRSLYSRPELREMCDLDFLLSQEQMEKADKIMRAEGYHVSEAASYHLEYEKKPFMIVELHKELMPSDSAYAKYYSNPWKIAKPLAEPFRYAFSCEDEYIFLIAHSAKHYYSCGTGIRTVMDVGVFRNAYAQKWDRAYILQEIEKLGLTTFLRSVEELATYWFAEGCEECSNEAKVMAQYIISSSTYGSKAHYGTGFVQAHLDRGASIHSARRNLFLSMVFPKMQTMRGLFPVLNKAPILLPLLWVVRWFRILLKRPNVIKIRYKQAKTAVACPPSDADFDASGKK